MANWSGTTNGSDFHGFIAGESTDSVTGPFKYPRFTATTNLPDMGALIGVTENRWLLWTDTEDLRDDKFDAVGADPFTSTSLPSAYADGTTYSAGDVAENSGSYYKAIATTTGDGVSDTSKWEPFNDFVVGNSSGVFAYYGKRITSAFAEPTVGSTAVTDCLFFKDSYLSIAETGPMHISAEHDAKQLHEIVVSFKPNSVGYLWGYAENEEGLVKGQYKGSIYGKPRVKIFLNMRGREFKIRLYVVTHTDHPWQIQEVALGHLLGRGSI